MPSNKNSLLFSLFLFVVWCMMYVHIFVKLHKVRSNILKCKRKCKHKPYAWIQFEASSIGLVKWHMGKNFWSKIKNKRNAETAFQQLSYIFLICWYKYLLHLWTFTLEDISMTMNLQQIITWVVALQPIAYCLAYFSLLCDVWCMSIYLYCTLCYSNVTFICVLNH